MRCGGKVATFIVGAFFMVIGVVIAIVVTTMAGSAAARAENLEPLSATALESATIGSEALIEGRISRRNQPVFRNFVAYIREEYRGSDDDGDDEWVEDERRTPPLVVEVAGGIIDIGSGYDIREPHESWTESDILRWNGISGEGTKRYSGLLVERSAMAIGTVAAGSEGRMLQAEFIYGGSRAEYIQGQRTIARFAPWFGGCFCMIGLVIVVSGVVATLRGR
jgi:hypothetical protein